MGHCGQTFFRLSDYSIAYFPTGVTAVSMVQKRYYEERFGREIVYIPNGITPMDKLPAQWIIGQGIVPNRYILFAARLVEEKGAHILISAFRMLDTDMKLVIAGDAAHMEDYKTNLRNLAGRDKRILFMGYVTDTPMRELFSNAYLFCLPSTIEGLPVALLDAMNYGNCCLASNIPENIEALGAHGFTFRSRDPQDLHLALEDLIAHPEKVDEKKKSVLQHVRKNYDWDDVTEKMEEFYHSLGEK